MGELIQFLDLHSGSLKSNGLPRPKIRLKKFGFSPKSTSTNIAKKLPSQRCSKPLFVSLFNFAHKWPTFVFTSESGYTLGSAQRIAHKGLHAESRVCQMGVVSLPFGRCGCVGTTPRGVYFGRKTAFSEWVLRTNGRAVHSCTQCFFGTSMRGWYHYPRRVLHAVETLGAQGTRWLNKLLVVYSLPVGSASAHSGSHAETRGVFTA